MCTQISKFPGLGLDLKIFSLILPVRRPPDRHTIVDSTSVKKLINSLWSSTKLLNQNQITEK